MKWKNKRSITLGTIRTIKRFAFLPITCPKTGVTYLWEWINITQSLTAPVRFGLMGTVYTEYHNKYWKTIKIN